MRTVAFDISPLSSGHSLRGVGFYTKKLHQLFKEERFKDLKIIFFKNGQIPQEADLIHYPYFDPFFLTLPFFKNKKRIVTVHDLIPFVFPDQYKRGIRGEIKWQIQKQALKNTEGIITDSINSQKDIIKIIGYPKDKIYPIYLAPEESYRRLEDRSWELEVRKRYDLPQDFILYVGDVNYNKNIIGLIKAFKKVKATALNLKLILIGGSFLNKDLNEVKEISRLIENLGIKKEIIMPGYVKDDDLVKIYNLALLYVQPSLYEGFGLPVLEAMASGCPVVCANTSSLPEIGGQAVLYCNPKETDDVAKQILILLNNDKLRLQITGKGLEQMQQFSWRKTIEQTVSIYRKILKNEQET